MPERPVYFMTDEFFVFAFSSVWQHWPQNAGCDAYFFADLLDLHLTDSHHDLAHSNILVDGTPLLLADFGLSHFKDPAEQSSTCFETNRLYYIALECQDLEGKRQPGRMDQASDIWSFACTLREVYEHVKREKVE